MTSPPPSASWSANRLHNEIDNRQFIRASLDHTAKGYPESRDRIDNEIREMEDHLKLKDGYEAVDLPRNTIGASFATPLTEFLNLEQRPTRPHTSHSIPSFDNGFGQYAENDFNGFQGHFASDGVIMGQGQATREPSWNFLPAPNTLGSPATDLRPSSSSSSTLNSSPRLVSSNSTPPLPTWPGAGRKRQRESLTLPSITSDHVAKSMRTIPSPSPTGTTTPGSVDSMELPEDSDFFRLMGGNPKEHMRCMREEQKNAEKMLAEKAKQERQDAELARRLHYDYEQQDQLRTPCAAPVQSFGHLPSLSGSSSSQSLLNSWGGFRGSVLSSMEDHSFAQPLNSSIPIKQDHQQFCPSLSTQTGAQALTDSFSNNSSTFIDLSNDSDSGDNDLSRPGTSASNQYLSHNIYSPYIPSNSFQPLTTSTISNPFQRNNTNLYDQNQNSASNGLTGSSPSTDTYGKIRQSINSVARGLGNAAYDFLDLDTLSNNMNTHGQSNNFSHGAETASFGDYSALLQQTRPMPGGYGTLPGDNPYDSTSIRAEAYQRLYNQIGGDPGKVTEDLKSLLENIRPDEELDPRTRIGSPDAMSANSTLYEHQKLGLTWMIKMEEGTNKGGILADDMGLGKTVQAIALMVSKRSPDENRKTTLIVAPVALLKQWEREIAIRLKPDPEHRLTTYIYHSSRGKNTSWENMKRFDVVLTTYGTIAAEYGRKTQIDAHKRANANWKPTTPNDRLPLLGEECKWYRVILDEAQNIKNKSTKSARSVYELQAITRFCMSGTPMMNRIDELFSLLHFLRIKPYCEQEKFSTDFTRPLKGASQSAKNTAMRKLQALLKAILLRRTKKSKIDGKPILTLPERTTEIQHSVFSADEEAFYRALESKTKLQFNKYLRAGTVGRNYSNVLVLLLRLRQACCHPHLIKDFGVAAGSSAEVSTEDMLKIARNLVSDVVARIKEAGAIECPICMDSAENATIFTPCGHSTCSECFTRIQDPTQAVGDDDGGEGGGRTFKCPNCRGPIDPKKVTDYNSFRRVHMPNESDLLDPEAGIETSDETDDDISDSDDSSLDGFVVPDDVVDDRTEGEDGREGAEGHGRGKHPFEKAKSKKVERSKGKGKSKGDRPVKKTLAQLKTESHKNARARRRYLTRLERDWETSAKIDKVMEVLQTIQDRKEGEKTIIFSQFTSLLDLLEIPINRKDWNYRRYDGTMSSVHRNDAVVDFSTKPECKIMLVSLKAGNAGLNLTAASQVIIFDPFWNPYIEEQAIDRAHRIGQRRPVQVHRILVPDTVEDRIISLQEKKRELIEGALDETASASIGRLGNRELAFLFGVSV